MQIDELILKSNDIRGTYEFYTGALGLELLEEHKNAIVLRAGKSILRFEYEQQGNPFYHFAFNITNNKLEEALNYLENKVSILPYNNSRIVDYTNWNARSFYFHDNNGSIVEFIVRLDLPYQTEAPYSSNCIREISEIGIVTDDVPATAKVLTTEYGLAYFPPGPVKEEFTVIGDDTGLLLITQAGRGWVPTDKPAEKYPVHVNFNKGKTFAT